jgi:hypothetical protein
LAPNWKWKGTFTFQGKNRIDSKRKKNLTYDKEKSVKIVAREKKSLKIVVRL